MATYALSGGVAPVAGYGDRWLVLFVGSLTGTWLASEQWTVNVASSEEPFLLGKGRVAGELATVCFTYRSRVYVGYGKRFNFSDNDDPTGWEEQNPGAGFQDYMTQFGGQDAISAFGQLQGRLAVLARKSIQIWSPDADPSNFALVQTLDNLGTEAPLSVQNLGDYDVIFLDDTGFRSLRSRETTLNATVDDLGIPVDSLVRADLMAVSASSAVGIVEPTTKHYWCYLNEKIYVLARHPSSMITAWSTYKATANVNITLSPVSPQTDVVTVGNTQQCYTATRTLPTEYTNALQVYNPCPGQQASPAVNLPLITSGDFDTTWSTVFTGSYAVHGLLYTTAGYYSALSQATANRLALAVAMERAYKAVVDGDIIGCVPSSCSESTVGVAALKWFFPVGDSGGAASGTPGPDVVYSGQGDDSVELIFGQTAVTHWHVITGGASPAGPWPEFCSDVDGTLRFAFSISGGPHVSVDMVYFVDGNEAGGFATGFLESGGTFTWDIPIAAFHEYAVTIGPGAVGTFSGTLHVSFIP
jgi:hypothetical protein